MLGGTEAIIVIVVYGIIYLIFSLLAALMLWGLAKGLGRIQNATFLNSWGLFWLLNLVQLTIGAFLVVIAALLSVGTSINMLYLYLFLFYFISIFSALSLTKSFWKCTFKQAFLTHLIPIILYLIICVPIGYLTWVMMSDPMPEDSLEYESEKW